MADRIDGYRRALESVLAGLGREDVVVTEVRDGEDGAVQYVLEKRGVTHAAAIAPETLADPQAARAQVNQALRHVTKPTQRAHLPQT